MNNKRINLQFGQELVEYALILPIFLIVTLGIIDLGRVVYYYSAMQNVVREGARYGSIHLEEADINNTICNIILNRAIGVELTCSDVTTDFDFDDGTISVNVIYRFVPVSQIITGFFGINYFDISTGSIMQLEYIPIPST
jgi:Flp pilus assembly protein TadG